MFCQRSHKLSSFLLLFLSFSFTVFGWFPLACLPDRWSFLLPHIILCWLPLLFLFLIIILFLSLGCFFSYIFFLSLCLTFHYVLPVFFWVHWVSLRPLIWTFSLGGSLSLFSFSSFSEFLSCSFTWNIFACLLTLPNSLLCVYVLGISGLSPSLEGVTLCSTYPRSIPHVGSVCPSVWNDHDCYGNAGVLGLFSV